MTTERTRGGGPAFSTTTRAGVLLGVSAAVYAASLAGVSGLQSEADAALAASRRPGADAVRHAAAANDALETRVRAIDRAARDLLDEYHAATLDVEAYQARLDALAGLVAEVEGTAAALPARISLPSVAIHGAVGTARGSRPPATSGRTGASGR